MNKSNIAASLAVRFAAKEAFMKSLGTGWKEGVRFQDIEVIADPSGKPGIRLHGKVRKIFENRGLRQTHLSLSHEGDYSVAMVVIED
jgi:holo-[acyl-carrier protein] synthase